jgi:DNA topoisomerase II
MSKETEKYKRLSQREHVLHRPGVYVGNVNNETTQMFVAESEGDDYVITKKEVEYNAGFVKIFDEILTNASDHFIRTGKVKNIWVEVYKDRVVIKNDGPGIPIEQKEGVWVPQMLFGELLTGENYDDTQQRFVGGLNGMGSALCNIFSTKFMVECADGKKMYKQIFEENLSVTNEPEITKSKESYTQITYYPDFKYFKLDGITTDLLSIFLKRTLDIAVYCKGCNVFFNRENVKLKTLEDYARMHVTESEAEFFSEKLNENWDVCITESHTDNFEQVSIVNGISTYVGGTHINYITNKIVNSLIVMLTKGKKFTIRPNDVKCKLFVFLIARIPNPTFDTQTKENMTLKMNSKITGDCDLSDKLYKQIMKSGIVESILQWIQMKEQAALNKVNKKSAGKTVRIEKLVDAHKAGTNDGWKASLILCEGDCLDENTNIKVFRNNDYLKIPIKDAVIGDMVITHNGNIRQIYGITKKVKECIKIKYNDTFINCSLDHKFLIYDKKNKCFKYLEAKNLNSDTHQLIKSKLFNLDCLMEVKDIEILNDDKYKLRIHLHNGAIDSSLEHKFTILNLESVKFELIEAKLLKKNDLIVSVIPS